MEFRELPAEEAAVRRYVEELWLPFNRDLAAAVDSHALADDVDLVEQEVPFRLERLESPEYELVVAVDPADGESADGSGGPLGDGALVGFVSTEVETAPSVFDRPDRLVVGDIYVDAAHRGTGLADDLMAHAAERAAATECAELSLDVDVDNERALAFYDRLGFEPHRHQFVVEADALADRVE